MPRQGNTAHEVKRPSLARRRSRKAEILTRGVPSVTRSIADAICIKTGNLFFLTQSDGNIPLGDGHGYGLYYHDCRYLNGYRLHLADADPIVLASSTGIVGSAIFELTNPRLEFGDGRQLASGEIGISWQRNLDGGHLYLQDRLSFKNYAEVPVDFPITLKFDANFEDIFAVRGVLVEHPGTMHGPTWQDGDLVFSYDGADGYIRRLVIGFSPKPDFRHGNSVRYRVDLGRLEAKDIQISLNISEIRTEKQVQPAQPAPLSNADPKLASQDGAAAMWKDLPEFQGDDMLLNGVLDRAMRDLQSLLTTLRGQAFFAAGVPWYATLFGRDSLLTALQVLAIKPEIAASTLRLLAQYQARETDEHRDAQPGKILHELRVGELAAIGDIPHSPYYGTVDATPLFLILMDQYVSWTGDLSLFHELRDSLEMALAWIDQYGDSDGDGYIDYKTTSNQGLVNQGWKDSAGSVINSDGSLAHAPIALVEVQGYVYAARTAMARLYDAIGAADRATQLRDSAEALRSRFNNDFWSDRLGTYVLALQAQGKPADVVASNAGHALWSGIADPDKARRTGQRLLAKDMFSGWGIRTLSQLEKGYNPIGYHIGSVWPHDTAMIAEGLRRYGCYDEAMQLFMGILGAAMNFEEFQLPELFSGFSREQYGVPVRYPAACHPQAWAAGSIPYLLTSFLGLMPHALEHKLEIRKPMLPGSVNYLDIMGLRIGQSSVNIRYRRGDDGRTVIEALKADPELQVSIS